MGLLLAGCAHQAGANGGPAGFSIAYPDAVSATAKIGKRFYAKPIASCRYDNGREAHWAMSGARVASGELPPGLTLEDGVIGGVPKTAGTYQAHVELSGVVCAGKPYEGQGVDVAITVK